jgi:tetratricopeptide (TPR) repeat protein
MADRSQLRMDARREAAEGRLGVALDLYGRVVRAAEEAGDAPDPLLHVRIADLHHRLGHERSALESYGRAASRYREEGLALNAVAVWERVLRSYPDELQAHRSLVEINLDQGLVGEARLHLLQFVEAADRMERGDEAVELLVDFLASWYDDEVAQVLRAYQALLARRAHSATTTADAEAGEADPGASTIPRAPADRSRRHVRRLLPVLPSVAPAAG